MEKKNRTSNKKYSEDLRIAIIISGGAFFTQIYAIGYSINVMYCAIIATVVEVFFLVMLYPQIVKDKSDIVIDLRDGKEWYVYQRIDKNLFLCGNNSDIANANEMRCISLETVLEKDYRLKRK